MVYLATAMNTDISAFMCESLQCESPRANSTVEYARKFYTRKEALHVWKILRNVNLKLAQLLRLRATFNTFNCLYLNRPRWHPSSSRLNKEKYLQLKNAVSTDQKKNVISLNRLRSAWNRWVMMTFLLFTHVTDG